MKVLRRLLLGGFTMIEVVAVVAALAAVSAVGYVAVSNVQDTARDSKLDQDVESLNRSVQIYLASGGSLDGITEPAAVLSKLKTRSDRKMMAVSGSAIDSRLMATMGSTASGKRAVWLPAPDNRFEVRQTGSGVAEFTLDETATESAPVTESSRTPTKEVASGTDPHWIWGSADLTASASVSGTSPDTVASGLTSLGSSSVTTLSAPTISPSGGSSGLSTYPKALTISNPNPTGSSQVYCSLAGGSYALYSGPVSASPGQVSAVAVTLDPSRYSTSSTTIQTYYAQPSLTWQSPGSVTYPQATAGNTTASVAADGNGSFTIRYTTDGSTPTASSPAYGGAITLSAGMWSTSTLTLNAMAFGTTGSYIQNSAVATATVAASVTALNTPTISPGSQIVFGSIAVTLTKNAADPAGTQLYYTLDGTNPTTSSPLYSGPFAVSNLAVNENRVLKVIAGGPSGSGFWFTNSGIASATYTGLNFDYANLDGVLIGGGTINNNAALNGSVVLVSVGGTQPSVTFNNNSALEGDIYAPGTPTVNGVPANRVINLNGATDPTNYSITMSKVTWTGNVYRRITPVTMPAVSLPTGLTERGNASAGTTLQPGHYGSLNGGNGGTFTLGVAGGTTPSVYSFDSFTIGNNARINIVGPVTIYLNPGSGNTINISNNAIFGNSAHPEWLQVNVYQGNLTIGNNGFLYGSVLNPNGNVTFENNSTFTGGVAAKYLNINNNGAGIVFSLPPPTSQ